MSGSTDASLEALGALVGDWTTEATHQLFPDLVVRGEAAFEWLEGKKFLIERSTADHPDFPDGIQLLGGMDDLQLHYFDSRGVHRVYDARITGPGSWEYTRDDRPAPGEQPVPGQWQRFKGRLEDDNTIVGVAQLSSDGENWEDDLWVTYRRKPPSS
jgi:hypothetical protein